MNVHNSIVTLASVSTCIATTLAVGACGAAPVPEASHGTGPGTASPSQANAESVSLTGPAASSQLPVCNTLVDDGPTVTAVQVASAAPIGAGGTISDGKYTLTALTAYTGMGGPTGNLALTASEVQTISGTTVQEVGKINGHDKRYTTTISTSDGNITTSDTCPALAARQWQRRGRR